MKSCCDRLYLGHKPLTVVFLLVVYSLTRAATATEADNDLWEAQRLAALLIERADKDGNRVLSKEEIQPIANVGVIRLAKADPNGRITEAALVEVYKRRLPRIEGEARLNLPYKQVGNWRGLLDLFLPTAKREGRAPVLVFFHGGGWAAGDKRKLSIASTGAVLKQVREQGFAAVSVDYRLVRTNQQEAATVRDCVVDCKDALRFLKKNAASLGIDSDCVVVFGESAGAHLAMMVALSGPDIFTGEPALTSYSVSPIACVSWYGPTDMQDPKLFSDDEAAAQRRFATRLSLPGSSEATQKAALKELSPIEYLSAKSPPLLLLQGDQDTGVPVKHALHLAKRAKEISASVQLLIVKNAGHNWRKAGSGAMEPPVEAIEKQTAEFIVRQSRE